MEPLKSVKELKSFMRISYIWSFIQVLIKLIKPLHKLLKKHVYFKLGREQQAAFQKVTDILSSPLTMILQMKGLPLTLYLTPTNKSIGTLLAQEVEGLKASYIILACSSEDER